MMERDDIPVRACTEALEAAWPRPALDTDPDKVSR